MIIPESSHYLILDFETFFSKDYTLKTLPTMQYIRDPRFRVLGLAVRASGVSDFLEPGEIPDFLSRLRRDHPTVPIVAHNAQFDGAILWEKFRFAPDFWLDTQMMTRYLIAQGELPADMSDSLKDVGEYLGLKKGDTEAAVAAGGGELAAYAVRDVEITDLALKAFLPKIPVDELHIMDLHVRMATEAVVELDEELLRKQTSNENEEIIAFGNLVRSNDKFAKALECLGVPPEKKVSKTTGKETWAFAKTDGFMQGLLRHQNPLVRKLAELRLQSKSVIGSTRAQRFLDIGSPLPLPLRYYGAHTGRSSGFDINPQNLPSGGPLRKSLKAPKGKKFVIVDSGQIEPRVLGELSGDDELRRACYSGDLYTTFSAAHFYRKPASEVTKEERKKSKPILLGGVYGQGVEGLQVYAKTAFGVELDRQEAERGVRAVREGFPGVVRYWNECELRVKQRGGVLRLPSGRCLHYPDLRQTASGLIYKKARIFSKRAEREEVRVWGSKLCENVVQAVARDVVYWQVLQVVKFGGGAYRLILLAHDEAVFMVDERLADRCLEDALAVFGTAPPWMPGLRTVGEGIIAGDYGSKP